jgi:hypothetical protein
MFWRNPGDRSHSSTLAFGMEQRLSADPPSCVSTYVNGIEREWMRVGSVNSLGKVSTRMNNTSNAALIAIVIIFTIALTLGGTQP